MTSIITNKQILKLSHKDKIFAYWMDEINDAWLLTNHDPDEKDRHYWEVDN